MIEPDRFEYLGKMSIAIGPHALDIDGDCLIVRQRGTFTLEQQMEFCAHADRVIAEQGHIFIINDPSAGSDYSAAARRYASKWPNVVHVWGAAHLGTSFAFSVVITMMARAISLFTKYQVPLVTFRTEGEARAWVAEQRQKRLSVQAHRKE